MIHDFDHLVLLVADLETAVRDYRELGFSVVPGGRHGTGTHNALIGMADGSYLELIAFHVENQQHRWWKWETSGRGLIDFCMRTNDLDGDCRAFGEAGVAYNPPHQLTRTRPDGLKLEWVIAVPTEPRNSGASFLIRDHTPREQRVPPFTPHANGVTGIARLVHVVDSAERVQAWASKVPGFSATPVRDEALGGEGLRVKASRATIDYLAPIGSSGPLATVLAQRGAIPYAIEFTGSTVVPSFDLDKAHGVRLSVSLETLGRD